MRGWEREEGQEEVDMQIASENAQNLLNKHPFNIIFHMQINFVMEIERV